MITTPLQQPEQASLHGTTSHERCQGFFIGSIPISPPVVLAPMADVTNGAYRRLAKRIGGPGLVVTEFISTVALHYGSQKTLTMFDITPDQYPVAVQIFGADPAMVAEAARVAVDKGAAIVDINMGCWVPKVCKTGAGAALIRDQDTACRVAEAVVRAVKVPVTVKTRPGWQYGDFATAALAKRFEEIGIQAIALHARFAVQGHSGAADWELIRRLKASLTIPVIGNGGIETPFQAARMLQETGCDGVMVGHAAIGNPWILRDIAHYLQTGELLPPPSLQERVEAALSHLQDLASTMGEERAVRHLRGQIPLYFRGLPYASRFRERMNLASTVQDVVDALGSVFGVTF